LLGARKKSGGRIRIDTQWSANADQISRAPLECLLHGAARAKATGYHQRYRDSILHRQRKIDEICLAHESRLRYVLLLFRLDAGEAQELGLLIGAARYFDQVDAGFLQPACHLQTVFEGESGFLEIRAVEFYRHRKPRTHGSARGPHDLEQHTCAVGQFAAVLIDAVVSAWTEELR